MKFKLPEKIVNLKTIFILYIVFAIIASTQQVLLGPKSFTEGGKLYTHYNNYKIFKHSFFHLINDNDLYRHYPDEHYDLYKYSPTFALIFGIFAFLPDIIGLNLWNLFNALLLFLSILYLPKLNNAKKTYILLILIIELMTSLQNAQSNAMIAGLIILSFVLLEREKYFIATLCIISTVFIKIFGLAALALFIFYPKKGKLILYSSFWAVIFILIPLLVVDVKQLKLLYNSWLNLLATDHSISDGLSVIGWFKSWFNIDISKLAVVAVGVVLFCLPLLRFSQYKHYLFRLHTLSSVLIWIIIFNHRAESATYIIAMTGLSIWYFSQPKKIENLVLLVLAFILTSLSPTDMFPKFIRLKFVRPYVLKAVPCIFVWFKIISELLFKKFQINHIEQDK